ncbi:MAG: hypothetical protein ACTSXO_07805 [Candidatus Heimdallarchaeota archaeon]
MDLPRGFFRFLKTDNEAVKVGYLNVMLKAEEKKLETAVIFDLIRRVTDLENVVKKRVLP